MSPKEYLNQAYWAERDIRLKEEEIAMMETTLYNITANYSSDGSSASGSVRNQKEILSCKLIDYKTELKKEIDKLTELKEEIKRSISTVDNKTFREVLIRRYIFYQKWETVSKHMHYSVRHILRIHKAALNEIRCP